MHTTFLKFASLAAALAAFKAADAGLVSTDADGADHFVSTGIDATGARFDLIATAIVAPTGDTAPGPNGEAMPLIAPTGEIQVDLYWQGPTPPTIAGGTAMQDAAVAFDPPAPPVMAVPDEVPLWALRAAIKEAGRFAAIDAFVEAHKDDMPALWEAWNMGNTVSRNSMLVASFAPQFQIDNETRDALMRAAAAISAAA